MIIDSANLECDACGVRANHHIMYRPDNWRILWIANWRLDFCQTCSDDLDYAIDQAFKRNPQRYLES